MKKSTNLSTGVVGDSVKTALRQDYNVQVTPRLTVDWNWNRYTTPTAANTPSEDTDGYDIEAFPIESITDPIRPQKGAAKARINESVISAGYIKHDDPKFYVSDVDDVYKYWTSPYTTDGAGNFPNATDAITSARPRVNYDKVVQANKLVFKFENTWATPKTYTVRLQTALNGAYTQIASNPAIDGASGTLTLYYNGTSWVTTRPVSLVSTPVAGFELRVVAMGPGIKRDGSVMTYNTRPTNNTTTSFATLPTTGFNSSLNVISMEAHLEADLTTRLIESGDSFEMGEASDLYPIGTITTNTGSVTLSNDDGIFNVENASSPYYGLLEPNAEFTLEYIYVISGAQHKVQQFKMYGGAWNNSDGVASVDLEDYSKYLKEIKPNSFMVENKTSTEIVWRVLDSVGFVNYQIQDEDVVDYTIIPVFWTTGEESVWEVLDELAKATQTAIYFDENGYLQVRTRQAAFKESGAIDWNLLGIKSGANLPDIEEWSPDSDIGVNKVEVTYKTTKWKRSNRKTPAMSKVWEPESDTLVVRSSPLVKDITNTSEYIFLTQKEVTIWPYKSKVQIDGEIIQYEGKQFVYYTYTETTQGDGTIAYSNPVKNIAVIKNLEDYKKFNAMSPRGKRHKNYYTGGLKITTRSIWNSEKRDHLIDLNGWTTKSELQGKSSATVHNSPRGFHHNKKESTVTLKTPNNMKDENDTFWATRGGPAASGYKAYGTRFKFNKDKSSPTQIAGFSYQMSGARENGYYVEVRLSSRMRSNDRKVGSEVRIYSVVAGKKVSLSKGSATAIGAGVWYEMDIYHSPNTGNNQTISVWVNGQKVAEATTTAATAQPDSGRFGLFAKGRTNVDFEYIYGIARPTTTKPNDDYGFYDLKYGGMRGGIWEKEYVWETRTRRKKIRKKKWVKEEYRHNLYLFDEFGPYVHEIREFDVKFDPSPVRYSYLFNTNEWFSTLVEYTGNPFGAKFIIANTSRNHAVLHGEDNLTYAGASAALNQVCVVLGQNLEVAEDETITKKNEPAIRSRGEVVAELNSDWLQSKSMAETLATWIARHWSEHVDEAEVKVFGNPLFQIGDLVDIDYPRENLAPATHKYFVVSVANEFDAGVSTTLRLRRRRIATDIS